MFPCPLLSMPELPEVTTTVNGLKKVLTGLSFSDIWTDIAKKHQPIKQFKETIKEESFFKKFKKEVIGSKVISVERRAKNILINLSIEKTILIHLKMTGHLLYGKYNYDNKNNKWTPDEKERESLKDPYNRFVHVVFSLSNGKHLVFSDSRKFGKVTLLSTNEAHETKHLKDLGVEPLDKDFTFEKFKELLLKKSHKKIKTVLIDQSLIVGIGNIYSDEILWSSNIHPESKVEKLNNTEFKILYKNIIDTLKKGIDFGGDSMSDYRNIYGEKGDFQNHHNVYRRNKEPCRKRGCKGIIERKIIDGRSAHFCREHQKLYA